MIHKNQMFPVMLSLYVFWVFISSFRTSLPSRADTVVTVVNLRTPLNPHPRRLLSPLTLTTDTPDPTTSTAMGTEMEPDTRSTTIPGRFMLTTAATVTDLCRAGWAASTSAPHTGETWKPGHKFWQDKYFFKRKHNFVWLRHYQFSIIACLWETKKGNIHMSQVSSYCF